MPISTYIYTHTQNSESEWEDQVGREKGMRERIQKDTVKKKIKGPFKVRMEIQNKRSFLKYLKPKNGEHRAITGRIFSPNEASSTRNGLNLTVLLAKGAPWEPTDNPDCGQDQRYSPQTDSQNLLSSLNVDMEKQSKSHIDPHPSGLVSLVQEGTLRSEKRKHLSTIKPFDPSILSSNISDLKELILWE